jgi:hypothetical protein
MMSPGQRQSVHIEANNLVYIKVPKTGSSTAGGVNRRIAAHHNLSGVFTDFVWIAENGEPGAWSDHGRMSQPESNHSTSGQPNQITLERLEALEMPYLIWSIIRDPSKRALSIVYWGATLRGNATLTTKYKLKQLELIKNQQFEYLQPEKSSTLDETIKFYNFLGLTDRYDESLVALAMTMKVPLTDVLYVTAKNTSAGARNIQGNTPIVQPPLEEEDQEVLDYLEGDFKKNNEIDYELFERINKTLDSLIAANKLEDAIAEFTTTLSGVQKICTPDYADAAYMGDLTNCYSRDQGCAYECIDEQSKLLAETGKLVCEWCE